MSPSALIDLETAIKAELGRPEARATIEGLEKVALEAAKNVLEAAIPTWLRPLVIGLVDGLAEKGITKLEDMTEEFLKSFGVVSAQTGTVKMALVVTHSPELPQSQCETVADWPGCDNKD